MASRVARRLAALALAAASLAAAADPVRFDTDYGPLFLEQQGERVSGLYPDYSGVVDGVLGERGEWLHAVWMQPDSERRCDHDVKGAWYWGTLAFRGITTDRFEGFWAFCDDEPGSGGRWNGVHVGGDRILPPAEVPRGDELVLPGLRRAPP